MQPLCHLPLLVLPARPLQRADGTISPLRFGLLWPYHLGLRTKLALQRRISSEPAYSQARGPPLGGPAWGLGPAPQLVRPTPRVAT